MPQFRLRTLFVVTFAIAVLLAASVALFRSARVAMGHGPFADRSAWPRALKAFGETDPRLLHGVRPYGLGDFIDHRSIWQISSDSPLLPHMLANSDLENASFAHPKVRELVDSLPYGWRAFDWPRCTWYATPGYGSQHMEGTDLYLIAIDPKTGDAIVLHEWLF
jgi:hypothetical protein